MSQVLVKAIDVLEIFINNGQVEYSLSELAVKSDLNIATVSRIVRTLTQRGYLYQAEKRGKYQLGFKFLDYSGIIKNQMSITNIALPYLRALVEEIDETAILASWNGHELVHVASVHASSNLRIVPDEGTKFSLYGTGVGKVILAGFSDRELEAYCEKIQFRQLTPNTITSIDELKRHLMIVRRESYAIDDEEQFEGVRNLATAIKNSDGNIVGAVGVIGTAARLNRSRIREVAQPVKQCAAEISSTLGYRE